MEAWLLGSESVCSDDGGHPAAHDAELTPPQEKAAWQICVAQATPKTGSNVLNRLEMGRSVNFFAEWCSRMVVRTTRCACPLRPRDRELC